MFSRTKAGIPGAKEPHCAIFMPISVELVSFDAEQIGLDLILKGTESKNRQVELMVGPEHMQMNIDQMLKWIDQIRKYIDDILVRVLWRAFSKNNMKQTCLPYES